MLASALLKQAVQKLRVDGHLTIQGPNPSSMRDVGINPFAELLIKHVDMYAMYEGRGWTNQQISERVGPADRAALKCAYAILGIAPADSTK